MKSYEYMGVKVEYTDNDNSGFMFFYCDIVDGVYTNRTNINMKIKETLEKE